MNWIGSRASKNVTAAAPGSAQGLYLIVSDIEAARDELHGRGVEISKVFHDAGGVYAGTDEPYLFGRLRVSGRDPEHRSYRSFASFSDPDGNGWLFQEVTARLPGRVNAATTNSPSGNLIAAGFVDTPLSASILGDDLDKRRDELRAMLPIRRVVGPADVAALAVHIMSNTALTGATYDIDGGQQLVS